MFRDKLYSLLKLLRSLRQERLINDGSYYDYMLLIWKAKTIDQLDEIAHDLAEISEPLSHSISFQ